MMNLEQVKEFCELNGYYALQVTDEGYIYIQNYLFTVAIVWATKNDFECGYTHRWCYPDQIKAMGALLEWKANGYKDKPLNYITQK